MQHDAIVGIKNLMKRFVFFLFILFPLILSASEDENIISNALFEGQELGFSRNYPDALKLFRGLKSDYPASPAGYLGEILIYQIMMLEQEDMRFKSEFYKALEEGKKVYREVMVMPRPSSLDLMLAGGIIGLEGMQAAREQRWWHAYTRGTVARQIFNRIKKNDPSYIDADIGRGLYIYWRSVFTRLIKTLSIFISDKRDEGRKIVEEVAQNGNLAKKFAEVNLGIIAYEEKKYGDALKVFSELVAKYPKNVIIRNFRGRTFLAMKKFDLAVLDFKAALKVDKDLIRFHYMTGLALYQKADKKEFRKAIDEFTLAIEKEVSSNWKSYSYYWIGRIYEDLNDKALAIENYNKAYALNKGIENAKFRLHALGSGI